MRAAVVASVLVLVAATGCGGPTHEQSSSGTEHQLGERVGPPQMSGDVIVYPAASEGGRTWDEVRALNARSGETVVVARSRYRNGMINWVARAGSWTLYVDQSRVQSDSHPTTSWQLIAVDGATRRKRILDSSGDRPTSYVPSLRSSGGAVLWSSITLGRSDALWWWKPGWTGPRLVVSGMGIEPATTSFDGQRIVFLAGSSRSAECWAVPTGGGKPVPLTRTGGRVLDCHASDGWLVWRQSRRPGDLPDELWAQHGGGQPVLIHRGVMPETYPYTSGGSLLWMLNDEQMVLESLAHPGKRFLFPRYFIRFDPFGDERFLGFVSETTSGYTDTAHLVDVWAPGLDAG